MIFTQLELGGAYLIDLSRLEDERGFFARAYCTKEFEQHDLNPKLVQCNISFNLLKGTLRGIHYQVSPYQEAKSVRCTRGAIYDVIVDLRKGSATYCKWVGVELNADNRCMLYVPEGFGHAYMTLTDNAEVFYQVSELYTPGAERGVRWNDPVFAIQWPIAPSVISAKDAGHPKFVP